MLLVRSQKPEVKIDPGDLMKYPLTAVPFSIGTADDCFAKIDKPNGLKFLLENTFPYMKRGSPGCSFVNLAMGDTFVSILLF